MKKNTVTSLTLLVLISFFVIQNTYASDVKSSEKSDSLKSLDSRFKLLVQQAFEELKVPGAIIGVWIGGYEPWTTTFGVADLKTSQPIVTGDKMRIGSVTKTFTGTVLLQLVDEGKLTLQDKLSNFFPNYPNAQNITIEEVGNMRSGIYNYSEDETFQDEMLKNMSKAFTPQELISISEKHAAYFAPDSGFHYSNTNFILLGLIIEKLTGNSLQTEIQNRILNPLGMKETTFDLNSTFPDPHAHGYLYMDSTSVEPTDVTGLNPSWGWAAGAMISTLGDLQLYAKPLATGQLVSLKAQADRLKWGKSFTPTSGGWADKQLNYGFAIADFDGAYGHNGGIPGFNSFMAYLPEKDATIIVLVNMQDNKNGIGPADYLARVIVEKLKRM
ncbi:MAG: beta-lactamase family protein [Bacteroidota bacterium]|nr:beta-lactamase family protein [Bacteroidota bacterium]